jgi:hypothetical protein
LKECRIFPNDAKEAKRQKIKRKFLACCRWLMPIILVIPGSEIRRIAGESLPGQIFLKALQKKWLKVLTLNSNPIISKNKQEIYQKIPLMAKN